MHNLVIKNKKLQVIITQQINEIRRSDKFWVFLGAYGAATLNTLGHLGLILSHLKPAEATTSL